MTRREALALATVAVFGPSGCGIDDDVLPIVAGWAETRGGEGGRVLRVSTLAADGPGSLAEACRTHGQRTIVFDVGGVIDLAKQKLPIPFPHLTIAGETAPEPGITLIRGGLSVQADHVIIRHLRVRTGTTGAPHTSGWNCDCINVYASRHVVVDQCSLSWGTDEILSASGPSFDGDGPTAWRRNTSGNIIFSNNLISEGLAHATHSDGEHSNGALVNANVTNVLFIRNMFANNMRRNPLFKGGCSGAVVNNLIFNPGHRAIAMSAREDEWEGREIPTGRLAIIGNVMEPGPSSSESLSMVSAVGTGPWHVYLRDNAIRSEHAGPRHLMRLSDGSVRLLSDDPFLNYPAVLPSGEVRDWVLEKAGARAWSRDPVDHRILANARTGNGEIIDSEAQVGGYPR